ncbi:MAG: hypothetical protein KDA77_20340, partial [Planctomycetaceae bacterium]|nr:hypothetical protein [Planctomycetaceae bacterium]
MLFLACNNKLQSQEVKQKEVVAIQDLDSFMKELERIRDHYREQNRVPPNAFVRGVINPGNRKFTLVTRNGKMRLDMDVLIPGANGTSERRTVHRLNDGQNFYVANNDGLAINNLDHFVSNWRSSLASEIYHFYMPDLDGIKPVDEYCDYLLQHIHDHKEEVTKAIASSQVVLQITIEGPLHTIEVYGPLADDGSERIDMRRLVLDARYGYLPVRFQRIEMPEQGGSLWKKTYQFETQYQ